MGKDSSGGGRSVPLPGASQTQGDERGLVPPVPLWQQYPSSRT